MHTKRLETVRVQNTNQMREHETKIYGVNYERACNKINDQCKGIDRICIDCAARQFPANTIETITETRRTARPSQRTKCSIHGRNLPFLGLALRIPPRPEEPPPH